MDRLEKALQKAREEREAAVQKASAPVASTPLPVARSAPAVEKSPSGIVSAKTRTVDVADAQLEEHRIVARLNRNANADIFRILRTKILRYFAETKQTTLAVTSPNYGDGKTTVAVNLALSIALDVKQTVLLVDLDLRSPSVHQRLGLNPDVGLSDYVLNDVPVYKCMVNPGIERLVILPNCTPLDNSSELLGTPKMVALAKELKSRYPDRIVIYDMPPMLAQDDAIAFLPNVDAVLMVVKDGVTDIDDVRQCVDALSGANVIGTVLNNSTERTLNRD
jgi:Mrp family chromosome partitioning ATPase